MTVAIHDGNEYWPRVSTYGRVCPNCKVDRDIVASCWDDYDFGHGNPGQAQFRAECHGCGAFEWLGDNGGVMPGLQRELETEYQRVRSAKGCA